MFQFTMRKFKKNYMTNLFEDYKPENEMKNGSKSAYRFTKSNLNLAINQMK